MTDIVTEAREALATRRAQGDPFYPRQLIESLVSEVEKLRWSVRHGGDHICDECWPEDDYGVIDDGFGNVWPLCSRECRLEIVRPGKVQCECEDR